MRKRIKIPLASSQIGTHQVRVGRSTYVYARIRKKSFDGMYGKNLIHWVAKTTLRRVKEIFKKE